MEFHFITLDELNNLKTREVVNQLPSFYADSLFIIGCFNQTLAGAIAIYEQEIVYLSEQYKKELIEKAKLFSLNELKIRNNSTFFLELGFKEYNDFMIYRPINNYQFENYEAVSKFIMSLKKRVYALDHFKRFMKDFVNIQNQLKVIHIGGTNGKGSTTNYIREVLQNAGYKVGTFTSPALVSRLDIIRINDINISEEDFIKYANRYMDHCLEYDLSMYEIEVFIATMYFYENKVDYVIFEVGLGGELDATNIVYPLVSVNTNIGLDHQEYLGNTYEEIARTKGGIIKDQVAFITGEKKQSCLEVFKELCDTHHCELIKTKEISHIQLNIDSISFDYNGETYRLLTPARYQCYNASLAIEVLEYLKSKKYVNYSETDLRRGLYHAKWLGRFEIMRRTPLIIIDGAHNKEGIEQFCESARDYPDIKIIFSALKDKDTHSMIEKLLEITDDLTICEFEHARAQKADLLAEDFPVHVEKDWHQAINESLNYEGTLFITGSLYFLSQVRPYLIAHLKQK